MYSGSYMSARVLLIFLINVFRKRDKMRGLSEPSERQTPMTILGQGRQ